MNNFVVVYLTVMQKICIFLKSDLSQMHNFHPAIAVQSPPISLHFLRDRLQCTAGSLCSGPAFYGIWAWPRALGTWIKRRIRTQPAGTEVTGKSPKSYQLNKTRIKISLLRMTQCVTLASRHALEISTCIPFPVTKCQDGLWGWENLSPLFIQEISLRQTLSLPVLKGRKPTGGVTHSPLHGG